MIQSLFVLSPTGEVLIERHFRSTVTSRTVCDIFWSRASEGLNHHGGADAGSGGSLYLFSVLRDGLSYLAACPACIGINSNGPETPPLLVIEFLHRIADTFVLYFGNPADESAVKDNFGTAYQLLEEMVDYGWPLTTEPNALTDLIRPPTVMAKIQQAISGGSSTILSEALPTGTVSNMPWRKAGVTHPNNEIYIDIVEEIDAILNSNGAVISSDVSGSIQAQSNLSGVPDLILTFNDSTLIDDCSFHPCVRYARFEKDKVVSFVPPDGPFELMRYRVSKSGQISLSVTARSISSLIYSSSRKGPLVIEDVTIIIPFPKFVRTANLNVTAGQVVYDEAGKIAKWVIGKLDEKARPQMNGSMIFEDGSEDAMSSPEDGEQPPLLVTWKILLASVSGLNVSGLSVTGEHYKPYKGVRNITKSGMFQIRCT
ncbi:mu subunit of clathrin adaptor complex AP3 [Thalassiosira pseudonana CCMP1335]|uniref:Mu subunit of clathrin adaptor complex AP3 n=1 Tax=Thalassiosira pseudonana TaxID=35128 RepID=B8BW02_THAPS|nr:mu subunit of clathrin adaptor complex AP3 [Thalassiosira pseudonana CCMP1335]EED95028.1 mu subunit of clathrin adaptor complex AP3 [Thalassiosira pseudonana CCMP1335]